MKRLISLLLAASPLLCFAGCAEPDTEARTTTDTTAVQTEAVTLPEITAAQPAEAEPLTMPEPEKDDFVRVSDYLPQVRQELFYATENNFTGQRIYEFTEAYLRYGTVKKLEAVSRELQTQNLYLKIWDGFRPVRAQFKLWEVLPDPTYVANPTKGYSSHSRGNTLDVTIVDADGNDLEMPTQFDDFSSKADRDYSDCSETEAANAMMLEELMGKHGFHGYFGEWWHFYDNDSYPVEENFAPVEPVRYYAACEEYLSIHMEPDVSAQIITMIPAESELMVLALHGDYAYAEYQGVQGYVLKSHIQPAK